MSLKQGVYLGISGVCSHDSAAAIVIDGRVVAAAEEERFIREKHTGRFPYQSIDFCLKESGASPEDVSCVAYYFNPKLRFFPAGRFIVETAYSRMNHILKTGGSLWDVMNSFGKAIAVERAIYKGNHKAEAFAKEKLRNARFSSVTHHDAHADSAFFPSPFTESSVLTVDLIGEWDTTTFYLGKGNSLLKLGTLKFPQSLGKFYQ